MYAYVQLQTVLLAPICPHFCEHVWTNMLQKKGSVLTCGWPQYGTVDALTSRCVYVSVYIWTQVCVCVCRSVYMCCDVATKYAVMHLMCAGTCPCGNLCVRVCMACVSARMHVNSWFSTGH